MALTEERLRGRESTRSVPTASELEAMLDAAPEPVRSPRRVSEPVLLSAWIVGVGSLMVFAPVPDDPSIPMWSAVVSTLFMSALFVTLGALATRASWGRRASTVTAGAGFALAAACAASGHHAGLWWTAEAAVFGGLLALTAATKASATT
jgi:hypothetical protein